MATPVVWVDHNYSDNARIGTLDDNDSRSGKVEYTNFQSSYVDNGTAGATLKLVDLKDKGGVGFNLILLNQSGKPFLPSSAKLLSKTLDARATFTIKNDGPSVIKIDTRFINDPEATAGVDYSKDDKSGNFEVQSGGQITIAGSIDNSFWTDDAEYLVEVWSLYGDAKVTVSATAVVDDSVDPRSQSIAVNAGSKTTTITGTKSYGGTKVTGYYPVDSNDDDKFDQIVLTFSEEVRPSTGSAFDALDFTVLTNDGTSVPSSVKYQVDEDDMEKKVKDELVLQLTNESR